MTDDQVRSVARNLIPMWRAKIRELAEHRPETLATRLRRVRAVQAMIPPAYLPWYLRPPKAWTDRGDPKAVEFNRRVRELIQEMLVLDAEVCKGL